MTHLRLVSPAPENPVPGRLEVVGDGVYAYRGAGRLNMGAVEADDFLVAFDAAPTPSAGRLWLSDLREHTDKPVRYLILSHYHALRTLGAPAFDAEVVIAHVDTRRLIDSRGVLDFKNQVRRAPHLFPNPEEILGPPRPDIALDGRLDIDLGHRRGKLVVTHPGRGHTAGDLIAWLPEQSIVFAGDLVEPDQALYTGDAFHAEWCTTLDWLLEYGAETLVGGHGTVARTLDEADDAIGHTREFVEILRSQVGAVHRRGGHIRDAFARSREALATGFAGRDLFESCLPFNVQRMWEELNGQEWPEPWDQDRDRKVLSSVAA